MSFLDSVKESLVSASKDVTQKAKEVSGVAKLKLDIKTKEDCLNLETLNDQDFNSILHSCYELEGFIKMFFKKEEAFSTMFFMNQAITKEELIHATQSIFNDSECGKVFRIKGFIPENDQWMELNATKDQITTEIIAKGQEIIIVIEIGRAHV